MTVLPLDIQGDNRGSLTNMHLSMRHMGGGEEEGVWMDNGEDSHDKLLMQSYAPWGILTLNLISNQLIFWGGSILDGP